MLFLSDYDDKSDKFLTAAKIGTVLPMMSGELKVQVQAKSFKKPALYDVNKAACDVWVKPGIVMEIKADELQDLLFTPKYALRFPRLERFRDDKRPEDVTT